MKAGPDCFALIRHFEQCRLQAYPDPATGREPYTCGWGSCGSDVGQFTRWTQDAADARLNSDVALREADANNAIRVPVTQGQYDAFVSLLFNVGHGSPVRDGIVRLKSGYPSTLLAKINARDYEGAADQFLRWVSPGSNVERGLLKRRTAEQAVFNGVSASEAIRIVEST